MADWKEGERTYPSGAVDYNQYWNGCQIWSRDRKMWRLVPLVFQTKRTWYGTEKAARLRAITQEIQRGRSTIKKLQAHIAELQEELKNA